MSRIAGFQPKYYMEMTTDSVIDVAASHTFGSGTKGTYSPTVFDTYLTNKPNFGPGQEVVSFDKATGFPFPIKGSNNIERVLGEKNPETSYEMHFNSANAFIPFVSLLNVPAATFQVGTGTTKTFTTYTSGSTVDPNRYVNLFRQINSSESVNQLITGAAKSITISGSEGEPVTMSIDWVGADYYGKAAAGSVPAWSSTSTQPIIMTRDLEIEYAGNTANISAFEITVTNNVIPKHYASTEVDAYIYGELEVTGSFTLSWGDTNFGGTDALDAFTGQTDALLKIYNDSTPDAANEFCITANVEFDDVKTNAEDEVENEISFTGVYDGTNLPFQIELYDGVDRTAY